MIENYCVDYFLPSPRIVKRHLSEVKVEILMNGGFSKTKVDFKKDMNRHTSKNSLRNTLSYLIAVLSAHFIACKEV